MIRPVADSVVYPPIRGDIAIIGVGCTYPGARRAVDFWQNIINKVDALTEVNPTRWDPKEFYDPDVDKEDRLYWKKGGWIPDTFSFNPLKFGIPPASIVGAEPDQCLLIRCVFEALEDAGYANKQYDRDRVSVMAGRGNYVGPGMMWLTFRTVVTEMLVKIMREMRPDMSREDMEKLKDFIRVKMPRLTPESSGGMVPNIATGRVANRFDFMGRNFTVDGACASALLATEIAVRNLLTGVDDMSIVGGIHIFNSVPFLSVFKIAHAVSLTEMMRPFDAGADGTMCGEGIGSLVLKRLADAERDGDRIYAVIKGVGSASDGKGKAVMAPRVEGQMLAIERAFDMAQLPPESVELVECHGTATVVGDATEIESLQRTYGPSKDGRPVCAIGSVKSMIGHAMPASGAASMIKTALALYHRVLPPTLNVEQPHPLLRSGNSRFYVNSDARPWIHGAALDGTHAPRRAAVSAFGFGGINAHVILEEYTKADETKQPSKLRDWESEVVVFEAADRPALNALFDRIRAYALQVEGVALRDLAYTLNSSLTGPGTGKVQRVAIVASSFEDLVQKIDRVKQRLAAPDCTQIRERSGLYYFENKDLLNGKIALMFPGEGSQYLNMLGELCIHFPEVRQSFDIADAAVKDPSYAPPSAIIYPPPAFSEEEEAAQEARLWTIERATESVLTAGGAMFTLLEKLGVKADMMTGHSAGEWIAMAASGMVDVQEFIASMDRLGLMYKKVAETTDIPKMTMLAIGTGAEKILEIAAQIGCDVHIANDNCPHQVVAVVDPSQADTLSNHLLKSGIFVEKLPYDRGYHTPSFTYICDPLREFFQSLNLVAPKSPVYSCTTAEPYPVDREVVLDTVANTFARPLLFRQTIDKMYEAGVRIFIEAGPRGNLTAFVDDVLRGKPHLAVPMDQYSRPGLQSLNHALGMLAAAHVKLDFGLIYDRRQPRKLALDVKADSVLPEEKQPGMMQISNCYIFLEPPPPGSFPMPAGVKSAAASPARPAPAPASPSPSVAKPIASPQVRAEAAPVEAAVAVAAAPPVTIPEPAPALIAEPIVQTPQPVYESAYDAAQYESSEVALYSEPAMSYAPMASPISSPGSMPQSVLLDHFSLMEEFLRTQEDIMGRMMGGAFSTPAPVEPQPTYYAPIAEPAPAPVEVVPAPIVHAPPPPVVQAPPPPIVQAPPPAPAPVPVQALAPTPAPAAPVAKPQIDLNALLLKVVSERTGYPEDMLGLDQDMEADLGIDSIKRVEIFGALRDLSGEGALSDESGMETVAKLKTLRAVLEFLETQTGPAVAAPAVAPTAGPVRSMIRTALTLEEVPGQSIVLKLPLDAQEHRYLVDHSLYFQASERDNEADRMYIMPVTCSIEVMCQTAGLIDPSKKVIVAKNVQVFRPLAIVKNQGPTWVEVTAKRQGPGEVAVSIKEAKQGGAAFSRCTVLLADDYPEAPAPAELVLNNPKPKLICTGKDIYTEHRVFHGPAFQGIRTIDQVGENGVIATLEIRPKEELLASDPAPLHHIDPHLLDAAGQLAGYWPVEYLAQGFVVLPIKIAEVAKFCDNPPAGTAIHTRLKIRQLTQRTLATDFEAMLPDGRLWLRTTSWEDWRFYWPQRFFDFWRFPKLNLSSSPVEMPALEKAGYFCRFVNTSAEHEKDALSEDIWTHVLLDKREFAEHEATPVNERPEWMFTRTAAKDAVRNWTGVTHNRPLYPADIQLLAGPNQSFTPSGFWTSEFTPPKVATLFEDRAALGVAGPDRAAIALVGAAETGTACFLPEEEDRLNRMADPVEWKARAVAAKQAVARYLRPDAEADFWRSLLITKINAETGVFEIADPDMAINAEDAVNAATARFEDRMVAVAFR